jgi:hypothetical protein
MCKGVRCALQLKKEEDTCEEEDTCVKGFAVHSS